MLWRTSNAPCPCRITVKFRGVSAGRRNPGKCPAPLMVDSRWAMAMLLRLAGVESMARSISISGPRGRQTFDAVLRRPACSFTKEKQRRETRQGRGERGWHAGNRLHPPAPGPFSSLRPPGPGQPGGPIVPPAAQCAAGWRDRPGSGGRQGSL
jgi:hypothetical protein